MRSLSYILDIISIIAAGQTHETLVRNKIKHLLSSQPFKCWTKQEMVKSINDVKILLEAHCFNWEEMVIIFENF